MVINNDAIRAASVKLFPDNPQKQAMERMWLRFDAMQHKAIAHVLHLQTGNQYGYVLDSGDQGINNVLMHY